MMANVIARVTFVVLTMAEFGLGTTINLVMVTSGSPRFGRATTGPAYDVAITRMEQHFPEALQIRNTIRRYEVYEPRDLACMEAGVQMQKLAGSNVSTLIGQLTGFTVILAPGCSLEMMVLGDFAREWNVPLLASSASDQRLTDKKRYPTVTAYGPVDLQSFANAAELFLASYQWRIVTLCCDGLSSWPGLVTVYVLLCQNIKMRLERNLGLYTVNVIQFDTKNDTSFDGMLSYIQGHSRIVFIITRPSVLRTILVAADKRNMSNGDFVFIAPESTKQPTLGDVEWRDKDDARNDGAALRAFQSTIIMSHPLPDLATSGVIFNAIDNVSQLAYNKTVTADEEMNDVVVCAYMSVATLAQVLNETHDTLDNMTAQAFSRRMWNKTYNLDLINGVYVDASGMKKGDVKFLRMNYTTGRLQDVWFYSTFTNTLSSVAALPIPWYTAKAPHFTYKPPMDSPPCGYQGEKCQDDRSALLLMVILIPLGILALSAIIAVLKLRYNQVKDRNSLWWCLDGNIFDADAAAVTFGPSGTPMADETARQDLLLKCQFKLRMYENRVVWTEIVSPSVSRDNVGNKKAMRRCLAAIKNLHHINVGQFYGVVTAPVFTYLVWEYGAHGSLRMLLDTDDGHSKNADLLISMVWDIMEGVDYIHNSDLHFHGSCSSLTAMVDKRFCIRLCGYASTKMLSILTKVNVASPEDTLKLWLAPEMLVDPTHAGSKYADMYSVALIILEIFTQCTPMDAILESETSCKHAIENLMSLRIPRIPITHEVPQKMHEMIRSSFAVVPKERPTLRAFSNQFETCYTKKGFVDKILSRLQKYSEDLENKVAAQTRDLIEEQVKVDSLLKQIIPPEFVDRLRNKEYVPCESFDCATIFFSDLPEFGPICASSTPLQIIALLNFIYSSFDVTLENYDVYKVETVNDSYMVVSGLPKRNGNKHVAEIARMAIALISKKLLSPVDNSPLHLRVGIHSGSCVAGIVGSRLPRYCLFGDTINTASRMESHGEASRIHISPTTRDLLSVFPGFVMQSRGKIVVKGKGEIETFWLLGRYES